MSPLSISELYVSILKVILASEGRDTQEILVDTYSAIQGTRV